MSDRSAWVTTSVFRKVAHDIVGGAGVTRGALTEIERTLGAPSEMQTMLLAMARRGLTRLDRLARRLRYAAVAESGDLAPALAELDLRDVARAGAREALELDGRKTVTFEARLPPAAVIAQLDEELVRAAISEVVSNAVRFARKSASLELGEDDAGAFIVVEDDGPGFHAEFASQLHPPLRPREGQRGSGLSLATVLGVMARHDGSFSIEPRPGGESGGRVRLTFPKR